MEESDVSVSCFGIAAEVKTELTGEGKVKIHVTPNEAGNLLFAVGMTGKAAELVGHAPRKPLEIRVKDKPSLKFKMKSGSPQAMYASSVILLIRPSAERPCNIDLEYANIDLADLKFKVTDQDGLEIPYESDDNALDTINIAFTPIMEGQITVTAYCKDNLMGDTLVIPVIPPPFVKIKTFPPKTVDIGTLVEIPVDTNVAIGSNYGVFTVSVHDNATGEECDCTFFENVLGFTPKTAGKLTITLDLEDKCIEGNLLASTISQIRMSLHD